MLYIVQCIIEMPDEFMVWLWGEDSLADLQRARERQAEENRQAAEVLQRQMKENEARLRERDRAGNNSGLKGPSQNVPVKPCTGCGCSGRGNATC